MTKVLFVTNEVPYFTGGGTLIRDFNLLKNLGDQYQLTVVCFTGANHQESAKRISALKGFCERVLTVPREQLAAGKWQARMTALGRILHPMPWHVRALTPDAMRVQVRVLHRTQPFDIVHANVAELGPLLTDVSRAKRVVGHEVVTPKIQRHLEFQTRPIRRISTYIEWKKFARYERALYQKADLCTVVSDVEKRNVLSLAPEANVAVIPNGVDTTFFQPCADIEAVEKGHTLLFIGSMAYAPNQDAVLYFHREIWPRLKRKLPALRWQIVGRDPSPEVQALASAAIEVTGFVGDVRPYMRASQVMIVPLRSGGGTRLKILEAMAVELPVVSTTIGAEGLHVSSHENILLADTPEEFADAVVRLLRQPDVALRIRANGHRLVEAEYDWKIIARQLDAAYQSLLVREA